MTGRSHLSRLVSLAAVVAFAAWFLPSGASAAATAPDAKGDDPPSLLVGRGETSADERRGIGRSQRVELRQAVLQDGVPADLTLDLLPGVSHVARLRPSPSGVPGWANWTGELVGIANSDVSFVRKGAVLSGLVVSPEGTYVIRYDGSAHLVEEVTGLAQPKEDIVVTPPGAGDDADAPRLALATAADPASVDVLVAYTPASETAAGGAVAMQSLIASAVSSTNNSYANSNVNMALRLVGTQRTTDEGTASEATLNQLQGTADGTFDELHARRDALGADLVALIVSGGGFCGIAFFPTSLSNPAASANTGFSVTEQGCAVGNLSFAHELGHNLSAAHDRYVTSFNPFFPEGFALVNPSAGWRTVMAYNNQCADQGSNCTRLARWSNPDQSFNGAPLGVAGQTDNQNALNGSSPTIAQYRAAVGTSGSITGFVRNASGTGVANVRMSITGAGSTGQSAVTAANGSYTIPDVPTNVPGQTYSVRAGLCVGPAQSVTVDGAETVNFSVTGNTAVGYLCEQQGTSAWLNGTTAITALAGQDDASAAVTLPFSFEYMGQSYGSVNVSTNGHLSFTGASAAFNNTAIPDAGAPNAAIYPLWDDLVVDASSGVYTATTGTSPNRRFAIEWRNVRLFSGSTQRLDVEVILSEDKRIWFEYRNVDPADPLETGAGATIGIENAAGTGALQASFNESGLASNTSVLFTKTSPK